MCQHMRTRRNNAWPLAAIVSSSSSVSETSSARDCSVVSESINSANPEAESVLQRLHAPKPLVLARKRIIKTNLPVGKKRGKGRCKADPKNVSIVSCGCRRRIANSRPNKMVGKALRRASTLGECL